MRLSGAPSATTSTPPSSVLRTYPTTFSSCAFFSVLARKKTPWTLPWILIVVRSVDAAISFTFATQWLEKNQEVVHMRLVRILCLDIGSKRIGVAVSDPLGWTAQGLTTIVRKDLHRDMGEIIKLCNEYEVKRIIIGMPLDAEGGYGPAARRVVAIQKKLEEYLERQALSIPVETWDERYSTAEAEERLLAADVSRAKRRRVIDKMAAVVILESYLRGHA